MEKYSIEEKFALLTAKDTFSTNGLNGKLPSVVMSDGPCGLRKVTEEYPAGAPSACYPSPHVLANSWDREVCEKIGKAIASDCIDADVDIILGPGINIKRTPLCGRNFEYFSEDPYLSGELAAMYLAGCESMGIGTSLKHFCANNREWDRLSQNSDVDERTLREIYTRAFEIIFKKVQPSTVMCSYNPVNGVNAAENKWLLKGILRDKLGYNGVVISDWGAVHDRAQALKATLDIQCPASKGNSENLQDAVNKGIITMEEVDKSVRRVEKLAKQVEKNRKTRKSLPQSVRAEYNLEAAEKGMVLLKNEGNILPLKKGKIAVLGTLNEFPDCVGGGSAMVNIRKIKEYGGGGTDIVSVKSVIPRLFEEIKARMPESTVEDRALYWQSSCITTPGKIRATRINDSLNLAYDSDVTIMLVGSSVIDECESYDRTSIKLPEEVEHLILTVAEHTENLVVVVECGSAVDMSAWIDKVKAVLYSGFAGERINEAIADILTGKVCPSGRLSETFPMQIEDTPTGVDCGEYYSDTYKEGVLVGYRWYSTKKIKPLFPFGYGLSYAKFAYSNFSVDRKDKYKYTVKFLLTNVSETAGGEVAQLYVRNVNKAVTRPEIELRRFEKVYLGAHENREIVFETDEDCFAYYNVCYGDWHVDGGRYELLVCRDAETSEYSARVFI